ncbi:collagen-like protein [Gluconobacter cadivus]|uniref:collagen-like protein n=1 Tax=Gluconobacter cadivus TaxID=2728101 RepID=UPI0022A7AC6E|nr:collagen-like protein [Gluconobacter cadivus]
MTTVHNLTPSPLRTVTLQSCTGLFAQVMWTPKSSADCLDYVLDFSTLLAGTGDTLTAIRSAVVTTAPGGQYDLKVMWSAVAGTLVVAFLASGQPNTAQKVLFEITTQQGRVYSVMAVLQITALTVATAPPSDFPADTLTNGKVLIAGIEALPSGYSSNGRVVMATEDAAPVGTPSFESVTAGTYSGDGSGLNVTSGGKAQTIGQWIAALSSGGTQGVGVKSINVMQGAVTAGQPSTVTLTATLTDGTTTAPAIFEAPAGAVGATGPQGAPGAKGDTGATGATGADGKDGANGTTGADGVGIASVAVTQGAVTAGQPSTVTLTATMTNGATAPGVSFSAPAGAAGSDADVTATNIETALGYTPANGANYFPLAIDNTKDSSGNYNLPAVVATNSGFDNSGGLFTLGYADDPVIQIGMYKGYFGENSVIIRSMTSQPVGIIISNQDGSGTSVSAHRLPTGDGATQSSCITVDGRLGGATGAYYFTNQDNSGGNYWKIQANTQDTSDGWPDDLQIFAAVNGNASWQTTPAVSFSAKTNQATLAAEPLVLAYNAYTFATLPTSPVAWQRVVVTDKAIGSGAQGVMAMWNPNTKAWTGLGGETLV